MPEIHKDIVMIIIFGALFIFIILNTISYVY